MPASRPKLAIRLPKSWTSQVRSAVLHVISLARFSLAYSRGWAADSANTRLRLKAELERAEEEVALLREELRIKDARMAQLPPHRCPYYPPVERMAHGGLAGELLFAVRRGYHEASGRATFGGSRQRPPE
jgi:hypothetical protein